MAAWTPEVNFFREGNISGAVLVSVPIRVTDHLTEPLKRKGRLMEDPCLLEVSIHGLLAQCFQACQAKHHGGKSRMRKATHFMAARKEEEVKEREREGKEIKKGPEDKVDPSCPLASHLILLVP